MPPELGGDGVVVASSPARPAAVAAARGRGLATLSLFRFKRRAAALLQERGRRRASSQRRRGDETAATRGGGGAALWQHRLRDALLCEHPASASATSSSRCRHPDGRSGRSEPGRRASRWWRIVGRFAGAKNRARDETAQPKDQKKARVTRVREQAAVAGEEPCCEPSQCGDLSRIARNETPGSRCELAERVLEPARFVLSESAPCSEDRNAADGGGGEPGARKTLRFRRSGFDGDGLRVVQECCDVVAQLRWQTGKEQGVVAAEARLLAQEHPSARATVASLGAVAPLISMLESASAFCAHSALQALHTLAMGNDRNKATIVDAGVAPKLLTLLRSPEPAILAAAVATLLSLSALDRNKPLIGAAGAIPELIATLTQRRDEPIRRDSLRALYNLSLSPSNIKFFVAADAATALTAILKSRTANARAEDPNTLEETSDIGARNLGAEKALAVLGNMACVGGGRRSIADAAQSLETLVEVLGWRRGRGARGAKCQEHAAYILMVMAHHSFAHRQALVQRRAIPALLEVSLLGSALAQKRAVRVLECLREDRKQGPRAVSAPLDAPPRTPRHSVYSLPGDVGGQLQASTVVSRMARQSLELTLQRIVRRANAPLSLSGCSSSKSLPF